MHGRGEKSVQGFGGKAEGKRPLGRWRCRWEDRMRVYLGEIGLGGGGGVDLVGSGWGQVASCFEYGDDTLGSGTTELGIDCIEENSCTDLSLSAMLVMSD
jgi:hypothetical protein